MKKPKLPDHDPLQVTPHEKFELVARGNWGGIASYEVVISRMARPVMNEAARRGLGAWREIQEVIERISWAYGVPKAQVERDLHEMARRYLAVAVEGAMIDGTLVHAWDDDMGEAFAQHEKLKGRGD